MRPTAVRAVVAAALGTAVLAGCGSSPSDTGADASGAGGGRPELSVVHPYVPLPPPGGMAAGYLTIRNRGASGDKLVEVTSELARDVTMHRTTGTKMEQVTGFGIPAGGTLDLGRGGRHLMLMGLTGKPSVGERYTFELRFAKSAPIRVQVPVEPLTYRPPAGK